MKTCTVLASAAHAQTCKDYREIKQRVKMLILKHDKTWATNDSVLDERLVRFSVSLERRIVSYRVVVARL